MHALTIGLQHQPRVQVVRWPLNFLFSAKSSCELRAQAVEHFKNLRRQIPLMYAAALVNLLGMHIATGGDELTLLSPVTFLTALLVWRMIVWIFFQQDTDDLRAIVHELMKTVAFTALLCVGFSVWTQLLITNHPDQMMSILLFSILAALGAAYGLSSFPRAAMLPLAILGLPMAMRLLFAGDLTSLGMGVSLLMVLLLLMRLLHTHGDALAGLIISRRAIAREHNRAIAAEVAAMRRADEDDLTGLANRAKLFREMQQNMVQGPISGGGSVVAVTDLDGFKAANDVFGHAAGDAILKILATRLSAAFGDKAVVARTGGDEFAIFWRDGLTKQQISAIGAKVCELASMPIAWEGKQLHVGASCGLAEASPIASSVSEFLRQADSALYQAKAIGRGVWRFYDQDLLELDQRRAGLERMLLDRQTHDALTVHFQPIISLDTNATIYAEALARWQNEKLGEILPNEFIYVAEQIGAIAELNDALLRKAIRAIKSWPVALGLSFNLSALQISEDGTANRLLRLVDEEGFCAKRILFEVTETAFLADMATAKRELQVLRDAGCTVALDDFGAGHASVSYLRDLVFDVVKFDGSLTTNIQHCERSRQILLGLIDLCHATGAKCVAEHVETKEQLALIRAMGCDFAQGFYVGRPLSHMPAAEPNFDHDMPRVLKTA